MNTSNSRRQFLQQGLVLSAGLLAGSSFRQGPYTHHSAMKVQEVIDLILKEGQISASRDTVDTLKSGDAALPVTGIVTTMFPTVEIIRQAIARKANFIIAHEPSFFNHEDRAGFFARNSVVDEKKALLEKNKIAIWRFHDYCHDIRPDMISYGVARKAGLLPYFKTGSNILEIPPTSLQQLARQFKQKLGIRTVRVMGDLRQSCKTIALLPGAWGSKEHVALIEEHHPDVLIVGESTEWETTEYIRDGLALNKPTSLIVLGHALSEEPGMEWVAEWLSPKLPGIRVQHIPSGDPYTWL